MKLTKPKLICESFLPPTAVIFIDEVLQAIAGPLPATPLNKSVGASGESQRLLKKI